MQQKKFFKKRNNIVNSVDNPKTFMKGASVTRVQAQGLDDLLAGGTLIQRAGVSTEKIRFLGPDNIVWNLKRVHPVSLIWPHRCHRKLVSASTKPYAMQGFIDHKQHLEFHLETNWQPAQLAGQRHYVGTPRHADNCPFYYLLNHLNFPWGLWRQSQVNRQAVRWLHYLKTFWSRKVHN